MKTGKYAYKKAFHKKYTFCCNAEYMRIYLHFIILVLHVGVVDATN